MILPIIGYGDPVLRKIGEVLSPEHPNLNETIANMYETMYNAHGVGLAAPQVGLALRLFVIDTTPFSDDEELEDSPELEQIDFAVYICSECGAWSTIIRDVYSGL